MLECIDTVNCLLHENLLMCQEKEKEGNLDKCKNGGKTRSFFLHTSFHFLVLSPPPSPSIFTLEIRMLRRKSVNKHVPTKQKKKMLEAHTSFHVLYQPVHLPLPQHFLRVCLPLSICHFNLCLGFGYVRTLSPLSVAASTYGLLHFLHFVPFVTHFRPEQPRPSQLLGILPSRVIRLKPGTRTNPIWKSQRLFPLPDGCVLPFRAILSGSRR